MSSSKGLKRIENISIVNPLVLETLEKLIEKSKPISIIAMDATLLCTFPPVSFFFFVIDIN